MQTEGISVGNIMAKTSMSIMELLPDIMEALLSLECFAYF